MLSFVKEGRGVPLVFLHAFPLSKAMWENHKQKFSRNFLFLSMDFPGFGNSSPLAGRTSMQKMAEQVWSTLDSIGILEPVVFIGVSMGGYVMFPLWKLNPNRVRGLCFVSTRASADTDKAREGRQKNIELVQADGLGALAEKMSQSLLGKSSVSGNPSLVSEVKSMISQASLEGTVGALQGMAERENSTDLLGTIKVPSLVVYGDQDSLIQRPEMEEMAQQLPRGRFETLSGAGHLLPLEQPAAFQDRFLHFLKRSVL